MDNVFSNIYSWHFKLSYESLLSFFFCLLLAALCSDSASIMNGENVLFREKHLLNNWLKSNTCVDENITWWRCHLVVDCLERSYNTAILTSSGECEEKCSRYIEERVKSYDLKIFLRRGNVTGHLECVHDPSELLTDGRSGNAQRKSDMTETGWLLTPAYWEPLQSAVLNGFCKINMFFPCFWLMTLANVRGAECVTPLNQMLDWL